MKKMLRIAAKLHTENPQLYEPTKGQSFLLSTASNSESTTLPPITSHHSHQSTGHSREFGKVTMDKSPMAIQMEYEALQADFEKEARLKEALLKEKQDKLRTYIYKEQEYRERIEDYSKRIR